ncbi:hypothetical protein FACS1894110_15520 [Spirochaetia bacterium]|nr:hypothetical protein FACS1894110_15520 [Spirochaetia bacterium]
MKNRSLVVGTIALLLTAVVFLGCPTEPGEPGKDGTLGTPGIPVVNGTVTVKALQNMLNISDVVYVAGPTSLTGAGTLTIPAGKSIKLFDKLTADNTGVVIDATSSTTALDLSDADAGLAGASGGTTPIFLLPSAPYITAAGAKLDASNSPVYAPLVSTVPDTGDWGTTALAVRTAVDTDLVAAKVAAGSQTLYVLDSLNLTGAALPSIGGKIVVLGTLNNSGAAITDSELSATAADNKLQLLGSVNSSKDITTGAIVLSLSGDLELTGTAALSAGASITAKTVSVAGTTTITGTSTVTANPVTFTGAVSLGGTLTVAGPATLGSTLTNSTSTTVTFNGATTVADVVTVGTGGLTIAGTGAVTLTAKPVPASTKLLTITNSTGVTLADGIASAGGVAGYVTISGGGKLILKDTKSIVAATTDTLLGTDYSLGVGTYTAAGDVTFAAATITTGNVAGNGLTFSDGADTNKITLSTTTTTPAVFTAAKANNENTPLTLAIAGGKPTITLALSTNTSGVLLTVNASGKIAVLGNSEVTFKGSSTPALNGGLRLFNGAQLAGTDDTKKLVADGGTPPSDGTFSSTGGTKLIASAKAGTGVLDSGTGTAALDIKANNSNSDATVGATLTALP